MALNITYRYKVQVPEASQRKLEGLKVKRRYPGKIPVSCQIVQLCMYTYRVKLKVVTHSLYSGSNTVIYHQYCSYSYTCPFFCT